MPNFNMWRWIPLRPNCLLTRHPLVLVSQTSGPSRFFSAFYWYALILRAHGYEVLTLTSRNPRDKEWGSFQRLAEKHDYKYHLIHESTWMAKEERLNCPRLQSRTRLEPEQIRIPGSLRTRYVLHREQILNLAISLAENDLK